MCSLAYSKIKEEAECSMPHQNETRNSENIQHGDLASFSLYTLCFLCKVLKG